MKDHRLGQTLGSYYLIRRIGQGHFATVYLGQHIYLQTYAAIKVLRTSVEDNEINDFYNEAQTVAYLKHPNIVGVLEFGIDEETSTPFLIMDYAPHGSLRQFHPDGSILPLKKIVTYARQISAALAYAHEQNYIHRDVKPENILLGPQKEALLSDFSLVTVAHCTASLKTMDKSGTVHYMAPEQIQGKPRKASDQYSLGVMVYEWCCGERPFDGTTQIEIAIKHLNSPLPPLREKVPSLSPEIERVVARALAKDPKQRYPTIQDFVEALEAAAYASGEMFEDEEEGSEERDDVQSQAEPEPLTFSGPAAGVAGTSPYYSVIDLGTEYARAAVIKVRDDRKIEILGIGREQHEEGNMAAGTILNLPGVIETCDRALKEAEERAGGIVPRKVCIGITGELIQGGSTPVRLRRSQPAARITDAEWREIVQQTLAQGTERIYQHLLSKPDYQKRTFDVIETEITSINVDGKDTRIPIGIAGQKVSFNYFAMLAPARLCQAVKTLAKELDLTLAAIMTTPYALYSSLQHHTEAEQGAIIIDVGHDATKITLTMPGELHGVCSFELGGESFTDTLATSLSMSHYNANKLKINYSRGQIPAERRAYIQSLFSRPYQQWLLQLVDHLDLMTNGEPLPPTIFLVGNGLAFPDLRQRLKKFPWMKYVTFTQPPHIHSLDLLDLPMIDQHPMLRDEGELVLCALASETGILHHTTFSNTSIPTQGTLPPPLALSNM